MSLNFLPLDLFYSNKITSQKLQTSDLQAAWHLMLPIYNASYLDAYEPTTA